MRRGSALWGKCDRMGFTELFTAEGRSVILPTTCKTWGCVICQKKLLALFKAKVTVGVSHLGACAFITTTYLLGSERLLDARCVQKDWQALWRNLKRHGKRWSWLKVTELTAAGTPHHHMVVGPVKGTIRCHGRTIKRGAETARYLNRLASCECLSHQFAREWFSITGDSFMCFATAVTDPVGAGGYMGKYMQKGFLMRSAGRRYSTSRDWPGNARIRLKQTLEGGWSHIRQWPASSFPSTENLNPREEDLLERVGENLTMALQRQRSKKAAEGLLRRLRNVGTA